MEEWDQRRAENRDLETMRRIALDAMELKDDDATVYHHADEHHLTVNEVVYYLNAFEAGVEAGLEAIRDPDIIPPDAARGAIKTIARVLDEVHTYTRRQWPDVAALIRRLKQHTHMVGKPSPGPWRGQAAPAR